MMKLEVDTVTRKVQVTAMRVEVATEPDGTQHVCLVLPIQGADYEVLLPVGTRVGIRGVGVDFAGGAVPFGEIRM